MIKYPNRFGEPIDSGIRHIAKLIRKKTGSQLMSLVAAVSMSSLNRFLYWQLDLETKVTSTQAIQYLARIMCTSAIGLKKMSGLSTTKTTAISSKDFQSNKWAEENMGWASWFAQRGNARNWQRCSSKYSALHLPLRKVRKHLNVWRQKKTNHFLLSRTKAVIISPS